MASSDALQSVIEVELGGALAFKMRTLPMLQGEVPP